MNKALSGIRVLDFTQVLAGPFCTMNLADFGAEVIKIEKPGTGDGSRIFGPFVNGQSGYYTLVNRGKERRRDRPEEGQGHHLRDGQKL